MAMLRDERISSCVPVENIVATHERWFIGDYRLVGRIWPYSEVVDESVLLRIAVDVGDQVDEVGIGGYFHSAEWIAEKTTCSMVGFVEGFRVSVK